VGHALDCSATVFVLFLKGESRYPYRPSEDFGHFGFFRELEGEEPAQQGDVVVWAGNHMEYLIGVKVEHVIYIPLGDQSGFKSIAFTYFSKNTARILSLD